MAINGVQISAGLLGLFAVGCVSAPQTAYAGEWRFHPELCPDLVEDALDRRESRRDERYDRGPLDVLEDRADRRESRRDESVTICPRSAWVWHGGHSYRHRRPAAVTIYYDRHERHYYRHGPKKVRIRVVVS